MASSPNKALNGLTDLYTVLLGGKLPATAPLSFHFNKYFARIRKRLQPNNQSKDVNPLVSEKLSLLTQASFHGNLPVLLN